MTNEWLEETKGQIYRGNKQDNSVRHGVRLKLNRGASQIILKKE